MFKKHANLIFLYAKKTGKSKGYAFLNVPDHVYSEIVKLNGVEFKSKQLVLEEAKTKHKDRTLDKQNPPDHQFRNYYVNFMHQHEQQQGHQHHQLQQQQKKQHSQQQQHQQLQHKQYNHNQKQHHWMQQPRTAALTPAAKSAVSEATATLTKFSPTTNTTTYSTWKAATAIPTSLKEANLSPGS